MKKSADMSKQVETLSTELINCRDELKCTKQERDDIRMEYERHLKAAEDEMDVLKQRLQIEIEALGSVIAKEHKILDEVVNSNPCSPSHSKSITMNDQGENAESRSTEVESIDIATTTSAKNNDQVQIDSATEIIVNKTKLSESKKVESKLECDDTVESSHIINVLTAELQTSLNRIRDLENCNEELEKENNRLKLDAKVEAAISDESHSLVNKQLVEYMVREKELKEREKLLITLRNELEILRKENEALQYDKEIMSKVSKGGHLNRFK